MPQTPQKLVINLETGAEEYVDLGDDELEELDAREPEAEPPAPVEHRVAEALLALPDDAKLVDIKRALAGALAPQE